MRRRFKCRAIAWPGAVDDFIKYADRPHMRGQVFSEAPLLYGDLQMKRLFCTFRNHFSRKN